jgi:hypothetical protein
VPEPEPSVTTQAVPVITRSARSPRWDFLGRYQVHVDGHLFIDRLRIIQCPWFAVLLTRIHQADTDRDPHNHSRAFWTFILSGSYTERMCRTRAPDVTWTRRHRRFSVKSMPVTQAHEITEIQGPLRTLVFAGRHHGTFCFWTPAGPADWRDYGKPSG